MSTTYNGRTYSVESTVPAGASKIIVPPGAGAATLAIHALGSSVSALIELSNSPAARLADGTARWVPARGFGDEGVLANSAALDIVPSSITAVRVTATGGVVVVELQQ